MVRLRPRFLRNPHRVIESHLAEDQELAEAILARMPSDEETLAVMLCASREHIASICTYLLKQGRIQLDRSWDTPRHWRAA